MMADRRPDSVGANQRYRKFLPAYRAAALDDGQSFGRGADVLELATEPQLDVGTVLDRFQQRGLQIGAVNHPIGGSGLRHLMVEREAGDLAAARGTHQTDGFGRHGAGELRSQAEIDQYAAGIGRKLKAGACFLQPLGLLEKDDTKTLLRQRQRSGQSPDTGARDDNRA